MSGTVLSAVHVVADLNQKQLYEVRTIFNPILQRKWLGLWDVKSLAQGHSSPGIQTQGVWLHSPRSQPLTSCLLRERPTMASLSPPHTPDAVQGLGVQPCAHTPPLQLLPSEQFSLWEVFPHFMLPVLPTHRGWFVSEPTENTISLICWDWTFDLGLPFFLVALSSLLHEGFL